VPHTSGAGAALLVALAVATVAGLGPAAQAQAAPRCQLRGRPRLEGRISGTAAAPGRTVDARLGETVDVFFTAPGRLDGRAVVFSDSGARGRTSWARAGCPAIALDWRRVEPRMRHEKTPAPNKDLALYANAVMLGPRHGAWIGFDRLEYFESAIARDAIVDAGGWVLHVRAATPSDPIARRRAADLLPLGTMRVAARATVDGETFATPAAEDAPGGLIADGVFRYTVRRGDGFLGWVTSFFNVPYLFGSAGKGRKSQAERYLGADCADLLVAALRRAGARGLEYASVIDLVDRLPRVGEPAEVAACAPGQRDCRPAEPALRFGADVRPGDLLAVDFIGVDDLPRAWDHIVAIVEDRGPTGAPDGRLGPEDLVADSGSEDGLRLAPLGDQGHVKIAVLRPR
jgi:hypothetical protein